MARTSVTIVLELDGAVDCPAGCARTPDGRSREFHGWLGLTEAIDALTRAEEAGPVTADDCDPSASSGSPRRALDDPKTRRTLT